MIIITNLLLLFITIIPKVTIISVNNSSTGIRIEDFILLFSIVILIVLKKDTAKDNYDNSYIKIQKIIYLYLVFSIISSLYGIVMNYVNPISSLLFIIRRLEYFILFYLGYYYTSKKSIKIGNVFNFIVIFHLIFCLLQMNGIIGSFNHGEMLSTLTQGRISSTFNGAYELSAFLLLILPYYLNNIFFKKKNIIKNLIYIIIISFCIIISNSRTSLIIELLIVLILLKDFRIFKTKKNMSMIVFLVILLLPIMIVFFPKIDLSRFYNLSVEKNVDIIKYTWNNKNFNKYVKDGSWYGNSKYSLNQIDAMGYDGSLYQRMSHWMQLIDGWTKSPIIGCGVSIAGTADGNYIKILTETGLLGLIVWLYLLYTIYKRLKKSTWLKYSYYTLVFGALFIDLFDASKVIMLFWFMLGLYIQRSSKNYEEYYNN